MYHQVLTSKNTTSYPRSVSMTFVEIRTRGGTFVSGLHISLGTLYSPIEPTVTSFFLTSTPSLPPPLTYEAIKPHKNCGQNYNFMLLPPLK